MVNLQRVYLDADVKYIISLSLPHVHFTHPINNNRITGGEIAESKVYESGHRDVTMYYSRRFTEEEANRDTDLPIKVMRSDSITVDHPGVLRIIRGKYLAGELQDSSGNQIEDYRGYEYDDYRDYGGFYISKTVRAGTYL